MNTIKGRRILVVEDEAIIAAFLEDILVEFGAEVVGPASTVARALALANCESIDAAILDVNIRDESVIPVRDALRCRGIPVIFATGYNSRQSLEATNGSPIVDKPYSKERIGAVLGDILAGESGLTDAEPSVAGDRPVESLQRVGGNTQPSQG